MTPRTRLAVLDTAADASCYAILFLVFVLTLLLALPWQAPTADDGRTDALFRSPKIGLRAAVACSSAPAIEARC